MLAKLLNRTRRALAKAMAPKSVLPTRHTHSAYPETLLDDAGNWAVNFYAYEPVGWIYQGESYAVPPANVPEPELRHPTTFAEGLAPAENINAWREYYAQRPQAVTHIDTITGKAANRKAAAKAAHSAMRDRLAHYRRTQP